MTVKPIPIGLWAPCPNPKCQSDRVASVKGDNGECAIGCLACGMHGPVGTCVLHARDLWASLPRVPETEH